jgi:hypothetical protein
MYLHQALAAAATLVSLAFGLCVLERWVDRRKPHELAWTGALFLFSAASAALWCGSAFGWSGWSFRLFYLLGAIVNVPYLALGTVVLLGGARAGRVGAWVVTAFACFSAGVVAVAPFTGPLPAAGLPQGSDVFGPLPRILAAAGSGAAAVVIIAGAVWSAVRFARRRATRRLALANLLIATGTLILAAGGVLNSALDEMDAFSVSLGAGILVIFVGFLVSTAPTRARVSIVRAA